MIPDLGQCKVLLVDDIKENIQVLVQALKDEYKLGVALNGENALEYARTFDLLVQGCRWRGVSADRVDLRLTT